MDLNMILKATGNWHEQALLQFKDMQPLGDMVSSSLFAEGYEHGVASCISFIQVILDGNQAPQIETGSAAIYAGFIVAMGDVFTAIFEEDSNE